MQAEPQSPHSQIWWVSSQSFLRAHRNASVVLLICHPLCWSMPASHVAPYRAGTAWGQEAISQSEACPGAASSGQSF